MTEPKCRHCGQTSGSHQCNDHGDGPAYCKRYRVRGERMTFEPVLADTGDPRWGKAIGRAILNFRRENKGSSQ